MIQDVLERILEIRGVRSAAVVDGAGETVHAAPQASDLNMVDNNRVANNRVGNRVDGLTVSSLATSRVLADLLGEGELCQTMIDFETGPVLLAPLAPGAVRADAQPGADASGPTGTDAYVAVLTLDAASALGRVRLGLRKRLPELARALQTS